jgi:hypothetical protein
MKLKHLYILYKNNIAYMKYLKKFEHFSGHDSPPDLGNRFTNEPEEVIPNVMPEEEEEVMPEYGEENCSECGYNLTDCECGGNYEEKEENQGTWGDEENNPLMIEKKNNKGFKAFLDKQKAKKEDKKETTKKETTYDKSGLKHPEKADLNKNKKISGYEKVRGKAIQNAVQDEKEEKGSKDKKEAKETKKKK